MRKQPHLCGRVCSIHEFLQAQMSVACQLMSETPEVGQNHGGLKVEEISFNQSLLGSDITRLLILVRLRLRNIARVGIRLVKIPL